MSVSLNTLLGTTEVKWNLTDLYSGYEDPQIEKDIAFCESEAAAINGEYAGKIKNIGSEELHALVARLESLETKLGKLFTFAFH